MISLLTCLLAKDEIFLMLLCIKSNFPNKEMKYFFQGSKLAKTEQISTFLGNDVWVYDTGGIMQVVFFGGVLSR